MGTAPCFVQWNDADRRGRGSAQQDLAAEGTGAEPSAGATARTISGACTTASATAGAISRASAAVAAITVITPREQQAAKPKPKPKPQVKQGGPINAGRAPSQRARLPRLHPKLPQRRQRGQWALKTRTQFPPKFVTKVESLNAALRIYPAQDRGEQLRSGPASHRSPAARR